MPDSQATVCENVGMFHGGGAEEMLGGQQGVAVQQDFQVLDQSQEKGTDRMKKKNNRKGYIYKLKKTKFLFSYFFYV
jgi:hypothetical protein